MKQNIAAWPIPNEAPSEGVMQAAERGIAHIALIKATLKHHVDNARADLLEQAQEAGVGIVHIYDSDCPKGGITVAFRKCNAYTSGSMVEVAVNTCSNNDSFSKKIGTAGALQKFFDGETIQLPLLHGITDPRDINYAVKQAFWGLYYAV